MTRAFLPRIGLSAGLALATSSAFAAPISVAEGPPDLAPGLVAGPGLTLALLPSDGLPSLPQLCEAPAPLGAALPARRLSLGLGRCHEAPEDGRSTSGPAFALSASAPATLHAATLYSATLYSATLYSATLLQGALGAHTSKRGAPPAEEAASSEAAAHAREATAGDDAHADRSHLDTPRKEQVAGADPIDGDAVSPGADLAGASFPERVSAGSASAGSVWAEIDDLLETEGELAGELHSDAAEVNAASVTDEGAHEEERGSGLVASTEPSGTASEAPTGPEGKPGSPWRYSIDLSDDELAARVRTDLASIGSVSMGSTSAGRILNAVAMPQGEAWRVVTPEYAWGLSETVSAVQEAAREVQARHPEAGPLRINHMSRKQGGHLRPHRSHQSGRDVDLGLYYKTGVDPAHIRARREDAMDPAPNWALIKHLVSNAHVDLIIVDQRIQRVLYNYALAIGEDREWLDTLFRAGYHSVVRHARGHRDHFHVRFSAPRSQELGIRVHPLLARIPAQNLTVHRVVSGDTLGRIAARYGSSVELIRARNGIRGSLIRVGQRLWVPLSGPCTQCPAPAPLQVAPLRPPPPPKPDELARRPDVMPGPRIAMVPRRARLAP